MDLIIRSYSADVHRDFFVVQGFKFIFLFGESVIYFDGHFRLRSAAASAAIPSPCPINPMPSFVVAFTVIFFALIPVALESILFIPEIYGEIFGFSAITTESIF